MLIALSEALEYAHRRGVAIAAVNVPYFEGLRAVINAAERSRAPVILQHAQAHEHLIAIEDIGPVMRVLAERSDHPFVLQVDHGEDARYIERGFEVGFNSAMLDGSLLPFEENVERTAEVVKLARARGFDVEGELGQMIGNENGDPTQGVADEGLYTDPKQAREFVERTGIAALAASFGTVHGVYHRKPLINYALINQLKRAVGVPLVMHGGSGLSVAEYRSCIANGVRKINYYTYAARSAAEAARLELTKAGPILFPRVAMAVQEAVDADVSAFIGVVSLSAEEAGTSLAGSISNEAEGDGAAMADLFKG